MVTDPTHAAANPWQNLSIYNNQTNHFEVTLNRKVIKIQIHNICLRVIYSRKILIQLQGTITFICWMSCTDKILVSRRALAELVFDIEINAEYSTRLYMPLKATFQEIYFKR